MRIALATLLTLHGLIHGLGVARWLGLAPVPTLRGRTLLALSPLGERLFGVAWLVALLALIGAAVLLLVRHEVWPSVALGGLLLSQILVVMSWDDAKLGTAANLVLVLPVLVSAAHARFERGVGAELAALLRESRGSSTVVEPAELAPLPDPVRRWLESSGVVGRPRAQVVRLRQRGELRTDPRASWMPAEAVQHFTVEPPAFIWQVDARMLGVLPVAGRDRYAAGRGHMLIKAASLVTLVDAGDEKIDHGAMLRFLGEIVWFPSAALSPYVRWEPVDDASARATMRHAGVEASAVFHFDATGRMAAMSAERFLGGGPAAQRTPWRVTCSAWGVLQGVTVPTRGEVSWLLPDGEFTYYRWELLELVHNPALAGSTAPRPVPAAARPAAPLGAAPSG